MSVSRAFAVAVVLAIASTGAQAQFDPQLQRECLKVDFDAAAARPLVGVWYSEILNSEHSMVQRLYTQFDANGLFAYQDQTCPTLVAGACSQNMGQGVWAIGSHTGEDYYIVRLFNDLTRTNWCQGLTLHRLDADTLQLPDGTIMQRVQ